jgi:hypothetical protein
MAKPTTDELTRMAREVFGRELSDAQAEAYRGRNRQNDGRSPNSELCENGV